MATAVGIVAVTSMICVVGMTCSVRIVSYHSAFPAHGTKVTHDASLVLGRGSKQVVQMKRFRTDARGRWGLGGWKEGAGGEGVSSIFSYNCISYWYCISKNVCH